MNKEHFNEFIKHLGEDVVHFQYTKLDGTLREAHGTLLPSMIPEKDVPVSITPENAKYTNYYDLEVGGWRTFINDNVVQFQWSGKTFSVARPDLDHAYNEANA